MGILDSDRYFEWLCGLIDDENHDSERYTRLLEYLHLVDFYYSIRNDENRKCDGLNLRFLYMNEMIFDDEDEDEFINSYFNVECSVLEMLIALSRKIGSWLMYDENCPDKSSGYFWMMVGNLGLLDYDDDNFIMSEIASRVNLFLNRRYSRDGSGGLFKIKNSNIDMRSIEIWRQANCYLNEN